MNIVIYVVYIVLMVYGWLIVARALLSWFRVRRDSPILPVKRALFLVTEPYLRLFRRLIPAARFGNVGLDLSALAGLVVLFIVIQLLARV